jgi:hypothetical protein
MKERIFFLARGKSKEVHHISKNNPLNLRDYPLAFAVYSKFDLSLFNSNFLLCYLTAQRERYEKLFSISEGFLVLPFEFGVFLSGAKICIPISSKDKAPRENISIQAIVEKITSLKLDNVKDIFLYEFMPFTEGHTLNALVREGGFNATMEHSLVSTLEIFFNKYAHHDLTPSNIMFGRISDDKNSTAVLRWLIVDNDQLENYEKNKKKCPLRPLNNKKIYTNLKKIFEKKKSSKISSMQLHSIQTRIALKC